MAKTFKKNVVPSYGSVQLKNGMKRVLFPLLFLVFFPYAVFSLDGISPERARLKLEHFFLQYETIVPLPEKSAIADSIILIARHLLNDKETAVRYLEKKAHIQQLLGNYTNAYLTYKEIISELEPLSIEKAAKDNALDREKQIRQTYLQMTLNAVQANLWEEGLSTAYAFLEKIPPCT